jgi:hypothetical protein
MTTVEPLKSRYEVLNDPSVDRRKFDEVITAAAAADAMPVLAGTRKPGQLSHVEAVMRIAMLSDSPSREIERLYADLQRRGRILGSHCVLQHEQEKHALAVTIGGVQYSVSSRSHARSWPRPESEKEYVPLL